MKFFLHKNPRRTNQKKEMNIFPVWMLSLLNGVRDQNMKTISKTNETKART